MSQVGKKQMKNHISHFIGPVEIVPLVIKAYISQMQNRQEQAKFTMDWKWHLVQNQGGGGGDLLQKIYYDYGLPGDTFQNPKYIVP